MYDSLPLSLAIQNLFLFAKHLRYRLSCNINLNIDIYKYFGSSEFCEAIAYSSRSLYARFSYVTNSLDASACVYCSDDCLVMAKQLLAGATLCFNGLKILDIP